jgi:hypothetical protein
LPPNSVARRVRIPGYLIMAMTLVEATVEFWMRASPMRLHSPAWRLGLINASGVLIGTALLTLFVIFAIAVAAEDAFGSYVVSSLSALAVPVCVLALGTFALDALEMKSQVQASLSDSYGATAAWVAVRLLISVILFGVLAVSALRAAKAKRPSASAPSERSQGVLLGTARTPAAATSAGLRRGADSEQRGR